MIKSKHQAEIHAHGKKKPAHGTAFSDKEVNENMKRISAGIAAIKAKARSIDKQTSGKTGAVARGLGNDLAQIRRELQTRIAQLDVFNEELYVTNEELQTTNEELEASQDELRSANTILQCALDEREVIDEIPVLFLDSKLQIKKATPAMNRLLKFKALDKGRPVTDFAESNLGDHLQTDARETLAANTTQSREVQCKNIWFMREMFPQGARDKQDRGVTITFTDISALKKAEKELRKTKDYLDKLIKCANAPIIVWDFDMRITRFNCGFEKLTGLAETEILGENLSQLFPDENREASLELIERALKGEHWEWVEIPILCKDGGVKLVLWNSANIYAEDGTTLISTIAQGTDITERNWAEKEIKRHTEDLHLKNEELARFNRVAVDRELRMVELKKEVNELHSQIGRQPRYQVEFKESQ